MHCVRAKANNDTHHEVGDDRKAEEMAHNATTTYSVDYGYLHDKREPITEDDAVREDEKLPRLTGEERKTCMLAAHGVYHKGKADGYPVHAMHGH